MSVLERFISKYKLPLIVFSALGLGAITARASTEVSGQVRSYGEENPVANAKVKEEITHDSTFADTNGFYSLIFETNGGITEEESKNIRIYSNGQNLILESNKAYELTINIFDVLGRPRGTIIKERSKTEGSLSVLNFPQQKYIINLKKGNEVIGRGNFVVLNGMPFALSINLIKEESNENNRNTSTRAKTQSSLTRGTEKDTLYFAFEDTTGVHYSKKHPLILQLGQDTIISPFSIPTDTSKFDIYRFNGLIQRSPTLSSARVPDHLKDSMHYDIDTTGMPAEILQGFINGIRSECKYMSCGIINDSTPINFISSHSSNPEDWNQRYRFLIFWDPSIGHAESGFMGDPNHPGWIVGGHVRAGPGTQLPTTIREDLHNLGYRIDLNDKNSFFDPSNSHNTLQPKDSLYRILYMREPEWYAPDSIPPISAILTEREVS